MLSGDECVLDTQSRAFRVDIKAEEIDLDVPPTSGMEYLRRVQLEAKQCPAIVVADLDADLYSEQQTFKVSSTSGLHPAPVGYAASSRWQREQAADFSTVRQKFAKEKIRLKREKKIMKNLPEKKDVEAWCNLCFGYLRPLRPSFPAPTCDMADFTSSADNNTADSGDKEESTEHRGTPPLLTIMASIDQPTVVQVLEYHVNWFEATGFTEKQGQWFYALLVCLEKPLDPEACSLLRNLARNCANLRASLGGAGDPRLAPLNLIICLVARYFDQTDLADNTR